MSPTGGGQLTPTIPPASSGKPTTQPLAYTSSQQSSLAAHLLPVLLGIGLVGLLVAPLLVMASRPGGVPALMWLRNRLLRQEPPSRTPPPGGTS